MSEENKKTEEEIKEVNNETEEENVQNKKPSLIKRMARVGVFSAIAAILYCVPGLQLKLPIFGFLEFHFDEIPVFLAGFAYDPLTAFLILMVKTLIKLPFSSTLCVGEFADLLYSCAFILPATIIYKKHRTFKGALLGLGIGFVAQLITALACNGLFMINFYMNLFGIGMDVIVAMFSALKVSDMKTLLCFAILPFNVIKDVVVVVLTILIYKPLHRFISKKNL